MGKKEETAMEKYIEEHGYNTVHSALANYIEDNPDKLDLLYESNFVKEPDDAELSSIEIIRTENVRTSGDIISADVIVCAEIEIEETVRRNRETDGVQQWFRVKCEISTDAITDIKIKSVEIYSR